MTEGTETSAPKAPRHKQNYFLAKVTNTFASRVDAEKFINENELADDIAILKGREVKPVEQKKQVLN